MFNIPLSTVRYLTRRGRVPALGKGKNRRLLPADLARELEDCKRTGRALRPGGKPARRPLTVTVPLEYIIPVTCEELRRIRMRLGLTQVAFAPRLGITANSLARLERGERGDRKSTRLNSSHANISY